MEKKTIAIIVAMDKELELISSMFSAAIEKKKFGHRTINVYFTHIGSNTVVACKSGIGKASAASIASFLITTYNPDLIISTGVCGTLNKNIKQNDIVIADEIAYHDVWCGEGNVFGQIQNMPATYKNNQNEIKKLVDHLNVEFEYLDLNKPKAHNGLIVSGDWFVENESKAKQIANNFPDAEGLDMESGALAQTAYMADVRFLSIRIVSDNPLNKFSDNQYELFWENASGNLVGILDLVIKFLD